MIRESLKAFLRKRSVPPKRKGKFYTKDLLSDYGHIVEVGDYTYGHPKVLHWGEKAKLYIGKFCSISDGVVIILGGNHRFDWLSTYPFSVFTDEWPEAAGIEYGQNFVKARPYTKGDVIMGNDVWVGYGATILSGVTIADGAVIGAQSVVVNNVEPYSVVAGNPAREIKKRFNKDVIDRLLKIQWWDWPIEKIKLHVSVLCSHNYQAILDDMID